MSLPNLVEKHYGFDKALKVGQRECPKLVREQLAKNFPGLPFSARGGQPKAFKRKAYFR